MDLDISKIKKVFFVGIGGIGISAIARMMFLEGKEVSGSDMSESSITRELQNLGVKIIIGQSFELIPADVDLIVYTIAIAHFDPKLFQQITQMGVVYKSYPEMLGIVTANKYTIAVSGTHGKTTTTAMIAKVLIDAKKDPSVIVGSLLKDYKSNLIVGKSEFFVVEACEYERSFLNVKPKILVITNVEADHLDYYKDLAGIQQAFGEMVAQTENFVVYNDTDINTKVLVNEYQKTGGKLQFVDYSKYIEQVPVLAVPGVHNRVDAAAAMAVAEILGVDTQVATKSLASFAGTWRRLEKRGVTQAGTIVYDDYAHHPTEIMASLQALRELYPHTNDIGVGVNPKDYVSGGKLSKKITVVFQPHLYSRTKALFDDFVKSFDQADQTLLLPIYFAREDKDESVSSEKLAGAIEARGVKVQAFADFSSAEQALLALNLGPNDILVTMGAGEAYKVVDQTLKFV